MDLNKSSIHAHAHFERETAVFVSHPDEKNLVERFPLSAAPEPRMAHT
jgi:hypothetical protein